MQSRCS